MTSDALRLSQGTPMKTIGTLLISLFLAACGGSSQSAAPAAPAPATSAPAPASDDPSCPVAVPGTSVSVEDTDSGAALVFVTTGDVTELRRRVAEMTRMHNDQHASMGALPTGDEGDAQAGHGEHAGHDMPGGGEHAGHAGGMISVHSSAAAEDIEGGARMVITAGAGDVARLQGELRTHAQHLASGTCEMDHAGH